MPVLSPAFSWLVVLTICTAVCWIVIVELDDLIAWVANRLRWARHARKVRKDFEKNHPITNRREP